MFPEVFIVNTVAVQKAIILGAVYNSLFICIIKAIECTSVVWRLFHFHIRYGRRVQLVQVPVFFLSMGG